MNLRKSLADKGYDPQTDDKSMGWICTIEVNRRVQQFHGVTEEDALSRAGVYVGS